MTHHVVRAELRIPAGNVGAEGPFALAARVGFDPATVDTASPTVLVCWPGGSYDRRYWDLQTERGEAYSALEHWAAQGYVVVTAEQLGVGESDKPADGDAVRIAQQAQASAGVVESVRALAAAGDLHPDLPALANPRVVGVGHSLGGSLVLTQQSVHRSYDAVVAIGITQAAKSAVEVPPGVDPDDPEAVAIAQADAFFGGSGTAYGNPLKAGSEAWLYGPNDDAEVVAEDVEVLPTWPRGPYVEALLPAQTTEFAAALRGPLMLAFSEIDIPQSPREEPTFFTSCSDITLFFLPDAAHCSNFSPNRHRLWDRIAAWERSVRTSRQQ